MNELDYDSVIGIDHELRPPRTSAEWIAFHAIRRKVLFENRGKAESYLENHPDDVKKGNQPLILLYRGDVIGVVRVDLHQTEAWLRRVAIQEEHQRRGHGRTLLGLAERFAMTKGCSEIRTNAAVEAVTFYERCGYERVPDADSPVNSVAMRKPLVKEK